MDRVDDDYGILQEQEIENNPIDKDEGYEEPSSSEDVAEIIPDPEDMSNSEAVPEYIPSEIAPVRPSVIMPTARMVPDSTTSPESSGDHVMRRGRMRLYDSRSSPELSKLSIVMQYLRELREPADAAVGGGDLMHPAARDGRTDVVEALIAMGASPNISSVSRWTPLHMAARSGQNDTVELLLSHGADIDRQTNTGRTPLHFAAERGHYETAFILLEAGAQADITTSLGITPMDYARNNGHRDIADLLLDYL